MDLLIVGIPLFFSVLKGTEDRHIQNHAFKKTQCTRFAMAAAAVAMMYYFVVDAVVEIGDHSEAKQEMGWFS